MTALAPWRSMFAAEYLKLRRSRLYDLAIVAPMAPAGLSLLIGLVAEMKPPEGANLWAALAMPATDVWSLLMLPFLIALQTALQSNIETASVQWKHLYALPISRARLYLVKSAVLLSLMIVSSLVLFVSLLIAGVALGVLRPDAHMFSMAPDMKAISIMIAHPFIGSLLILGLHQWISHRWPSIVAALGIALVALTASIVAMQSERWGQYFPWCLPMRLRHGPESQRAFVLTYSSVGWAITVALGAWDARRREMV